MNWIERRIAAAREQGATSLDLSVPFWRGPGESSGSGVLNSIPAAIFDLGLLKRLDLTGHDIAEIPSAIGRMANLSDLAVSNHGGVIVCREIGRLPLRRLAIECTGEVVINLDLLPELEDLSLSAGSRRALVGLGSLRRLTRLQLNLPMARVPAALRGLRSIRTLALHNRAREQRLALGNFGCSKILEELRLSGDWDLSGSHMPGLSSLAFEGPRSEIPDHFLELPLRKLKLTAPDDDRWSRLTHLEDLTLHGSRGTIVRPVLLSSLTHLKRLELYLLAVDTTDLDWVLERGKLEELALLDLEGNPAISLVHCKHLRKLTLSADQPLEVQGTIGDLNLLENLSLWNCKPSTVRDLYALGRLRSLFLARMPLGGWPEWLSGLMELRDLSLFATDLDAVPAAVSSLRNLEQLDLSGNELREIHARSLSSLT